MGKRRRGKKRTIIILSPGVKIYIRGRCCNGPVVPLR